MPEPIVLRPPLVPAVQSRHLQGAADIRTTNRLSFVHNAPTTPPTILQHVCHRTSTTDPEVQVLPVRTFGRGSHHLHRSLWALDTAALVANAEDKSMVSNPLRRRWHLYVLPLSLSTLHPLKYMQSLPWVTLVAISRARRQRRSTL